MKKSICLLASILCVSGIASAAPLILVTTLPDLGAPISVITKYTVSTGVLEISGNVLQFQYSGGTVAVTGTNTFDIFTHVDTSGVVTNVTTNDPAWAPVGASSGIQVNGVVTALSLTQQVLLQSTSLYNSPVSTGDFGFTTAGGNGEGYQFIFSAPDSGGLASYYAPSFPNLINVIVNAGTRCTAVGGSCLAGYTTGNGNNFTANFEYTGGSVDIKGDAPEPGTMLLLASGTGLLGLMRRRFSASKS